MSKKSKDIVGMILFVVGLAMLVGWGITAACIHIVLPRYVGTEIFWTQEEYVEFKEAVAEYEGVIEEAVVLSSDPPIIVTFTIKVERGVDFPYGNPRAKEIPYENYWYIFMAVGGGLIGASALIPNEEVEA